MKLSGETSRRDFLKLTVAGTAALGALPASLPAKPAQGGGKLALDKGLVYSMLPKDLRVEDRFKLARDTGFNVVQVPAPPDMREAENLKKAADAAGIRIDSTMNPGLWQHPLTSADASAVKKSVEGVRNTLLTARMWGADAILLVPAVVTPQTSYHEAWVRSQKQIRKLLPLAEKLKVVIAIEEVWNKFLLSPLEMRTYIDEFRSPWVKSWFDVGNVVLYGYPQDWIYTLGKRIAKVHLKDFKLDRSQGRFEWVNLGDGQVMWPAVRQAL